jgi:hypothetical protein
MVIDSTTEINAKDKLSLANNFMILLYHNNTNWLIYSKYEYALQ